MRIELLGPFTVRYDDGGAATPPSPKRRALLAALAARLDRPVPVDELIELVWDGSPPPTARAALQGHVAALRRLLDDRLVLATRGTGYLLTGDPGQVDALRFRQLCAGAGVQLPDGTPGGPAPYGPPADHGGPGRYGSDLRGLGHHGSDFRGSDFRGPDFRGPDFRGPDHRGPEDRALGLLRSALDLWRGPALGGCGSALLCERLAPGLTELRLRALDRLADGLCRVGRGGELVAELTEAVAAHPAHRQLADRLRSCLDQAERRSGTLSEHPVEHRTFGSTGHRSGPQDPPPAVPSPVLPSPVFPSSAVLPSATPSPAALSPAAPRTAAPQAEPAPAPATARSAPTLAGPAAAVPATAARLPRGDRKFAGRAAELARLDDTLAPGRERRPVLVSGPAGVGKSALVRYWAQQAADRFPDGILHADLRGFAEAGPRDPADVLAQFLTALGEDAGQLPAGTDQRSHRYRELLTGRRILVVLDDASSYEQLVPLLPDPPPEHAPDGAAPVAVVTSRSRLCELVVHEGALPLPLGALTPADARGLLVRALGPDRVAAEPESAAALARLCGHLPLALRLACARLAGRPGWTLGDLAAALADERTRPAATVPAGGGVASAVGAALDLTLRALPPAAVRLFALLGLHPGATVDVPTAAALAAVPAATARELLNRLDAVHLVEEEVPGRYLRREPVRVHASGTAAGLPHEERLAAVDRLTGHCLAATAAACTALHTGDGPPADLLQTPCGASAPELLPGPLPGPLPGRPPGAGRASAGASPLPSGCAATWFRAEADTVHALVQLAAEHGRDATAWQLAHRAALLHEAVRPARGPGAGPRTGGGGEPAPDCRAQRRSTAEAGLRAARACADPAAVARLTADLAVVRTEQGDERAAAQLTDALAAADRAGDPLLRHHARARTAAALTATGRPDRAVPLLTDLVAEARTRDARPPAEPGPLARALAALAEALAATGSAVDALAAADEALRLLAGSPGRIETVLAARSRARALQALGRPGAALDAANLALALGRVHGDPRVQARSHSLVADLLDALGRTDDARAAREAAGASAAATR
ncbi:BTAD domain-containing putative transcriptional regulator [Kitasatospora sp. NPDC054939]